MVVVVRITITITVIIIRVGNKDSIETNNATEAFFRIKANRTTRRWALCSTYSFVRSFAHSFIRSSTPPNGAFPDQGSSKYSDLLNTKAINQCSDDDDDDDTKDKRIVMNDLIAIVNKS